MSRPDEFAGAFAQVSAGSLNGEVLNTETSYAAAQNGVFESNGATRITASFDNLSGTAVDGQAMASVYALNKGHEVDLIPEPETYLLDGADWRAVDWCRGASPKMSPRPVCRPCMNFSCYAENPMAIWSLVRHGLGIGPMLDDIAWNMPDVARVLDGVQPVYCPIWLVTHRELRTARRIGSVFDLLADALSAEPAGAA